MTNLENEKMDEEQLKRYLYAEMTLEERELFEEELFAGDALFSEAIDLENELVDLYAAKKLSGEELLRFERSLEKFPERKEKIANAVALRTFIEEEKSYSFAEDTETRKQTFWEKLSGMFTMPVLTYAMSGILVLLTVFSVVLFLDNRQKQEELAGLQNIGQDNKSIKPQIEEQLREKLEQANERENQLQKKIDNEREATGELAEELERERQTREKLGNELEKLREKNSNIPPVNTETSQPRIASIKLNPTRFNVAEKEIRTASIGNKTSLIAINLSLPDETKNDERFSVNLNSKPFLENIAARTAANGKKNISLTIQTENLPNGKNKLTVLDKNGKEITEYLFEVNKQ